MIGIGRYDVTKPFTTWQPMPVIAKAVYFQMIEADPMAVAVLLGEQNVDPPRWDRA